MKVNLITGASTFRPNIISINNSFTNPFKKLKEKVATMLDSMPISYSPTRINRSPLKISFAKLKPNRRLSRVGVIVLVAILLGGLGIFLATRKGSSTLGSSERKVDQSYSVLARDKNGNSLGKYVSFNVTSVQKVNTVLVKGQTLRARNGKEFLLVNFETNNPGQTVFYLNPTDLVRYQAADGKKYSPTVYQGILEVRPDSTKTSNIGFVIEPDDKNFKLEVGDIESQKQQMEIKF